MTKLVKYLLITGLGLNFTSILAQQKTYDFVVPLPPESRNLMAIPPKLYGTYLDTTSKQKIIVKSRGVFIQHTIYGQLPEIVVDTSSRYEVRNESIFGVVEGDSLPCFKKDSIYYFGMLKTSEIFSFNGKNGMRKIDENQDDYQYFVCSETNGYWVPMILVFEGNKLTIKRPLFEELENPFQNIVVQFNEEKNNLIYIHLHPTPEEWKQIDLTKYFGADQVFVR